MRSGQTEGKTIATCKEETAMKILFLHGWQSTPGGLKPNYLLDHGHEVLNPALPDNDFDAAVRIAQGEFDRHHPDVVVGSSRGGAVAMNINSGNTPLVLLCPAWKRWGVAQSVKYNTVILHAKTDETIPFADSQELIYNSGLPESALIVVGHEHRLANEESLKTMLEVAERICKSENLIDCHKAKADWRLVFYIILSIMTLYTVSFVLLFKVLRISSEIPLGVVTVILFFTTIGLGQKLLYQGKRRFRASLVIGGSFFIAQYIFLYSIVSFEHVVGTHLTTFQFPFTPFDPKEAIVFGAVYGLMFSLLVGGEFLVVYGARQFWNKISKWQQASKIQTKNSQYDQRCHARADLSVACQLVLNISSLLQRFGVRQRLAICLSLIVLAELPLLCTAFEVLWGTFGTVFNTLLPVLWPSVLVLVCMIFALRATEHLIDSEAAAMSLVANDQAQNYSKTWRIHYNPLRQIAFSAIVGISSAIFSFLAVRAIGESLVFSLLCAASVLLSGTLGGLCFYVGALTPFLTYILSKYECNLHRFAPASTTEIRQISTNTTRTIMEGVVVGIILSMPLLWWASMHTTIGLLKSLSIFVLCAWLVILVAFVAVHRNLSHIIVRVKDRTRKELSALIEDSHRDFPNADENGLKRLEMLVNLDRSVYESPRYAIDIKSAWQTISVFLVAAIPVALKFLWDILVGK
jgi:hypothetical protein